LTGVKRTIELAVIADKGNRYRDAVKGRKLNKAWEEKAGGGLPNERGGTPAPSILAASKGIVRALTGEQGAKKKKWESAQDDGQDSRQSDGGGGRLRQSGGLGGLAGPANK